MKQLIQLTTVSFFAICSLTSTAQDVHFSQMFETPLLRNPSLAGLFTGDVRLQSVIRSQWNTVTVPYQTTSLSAEVKKKVGSADDFITLGGQVVYDKAGTIALTSTQLLPSLNYHKSLSADRNTYLSFGFMGGLVQRRFDRSKMTTNNQYDGNAYNSELADGETFLKPSYSYFDGSVGISLNSQIGENFDNNFYAGLAYHHFNQAKKTSFYESEDVRMTPKWVGSFGIRMSMTERSYFTLQSDYSVQGNNKEIIGGALYSMKLDNAEVSKYSLHIGSYLRWKDAIIPVAKLEFNGMSISASYDANISMLKQSSNGQGGFELSLAYQKAKKNNSSLDAVKCPKF